MMEIGGLLRHRDRWFSCRSRRSIIAKRVLRTNIIERKREEKKRKTNDKNVGDIFTIGI
jgi:hypothetical protein